MSTLENVSTKTSKLWFKKKKKRQANFDSLQRPYRQFSLKFEFVQFKN